MIPNFDRCKKCGMIHAAGFDCRVGDRVPGWPLGMTCGAIDDVRSGRGLPPLEPSITLDSRIQLLEEALDHPLLRKVLGFVEDCAPDEVMATQRAWMAIRDEVL